MRCKTVPNPAMLILAFLASASGGTAETSYVEIVKLTAPDLAPLDLLGEALDIDGDVAVVSSDEWGIDKGAVYIYERGAGGSNRWGMTAQVLDPTPEVGELFGYSVAFDDGTLLVASVPDTTTVFERHASSDRWAIVTQITEIGGGTLAIKDNTFIAARADLDTVRVHERDAGGEDHWGLVAELVTSQGEVRGFASDADIDGDVMVVGAKLDSGPFIETGSAYVWERDEDGLWTKEETVKLVAPDGERDDDFGDGVAVERDLIAVGAPCHDTSVNNSGTVYVFRREAFGVWSQVAKLVIHDPVLSDKLGSSVAISDGRVIAAAHGRDEGSDTNVGAVFVFEEDERGGWAQVAELRAADSSELDRLGWGAVAASGGTILAGTPNDDEHGAETGAAYVFQIVADPQVKLSGRCPGSVTLAISGATPSGPVAIAGSAEEGLTTIPGGRCEQITLALQDARLLGQSMVGSDGTLEMTRSVVKRTCGVFVQAVDITTCGTGEPVRIP